MSCVDEASFLDGKGGKKSFQLDTGGRNGISPDTLGNIVPADYQVKSFNL